MILAQEKALAASKKARQSWEKVEKLQAKKKGGDKKEVKKET
jgi:hypothetical protein